MIGGKGAAMNANPIPAALAVDYAEAGRLCGVCGETIARAVRRGELPAVTIGRRSRRIRIADLDAWLAHKVSVTADPTANA